MSHGRAAYITTLLSVVAALPLIAGCARPASIPDGTYYGYEPMGNLSPDQPDASWYHENVMTVRGGAIRIEKSPQWRLRDSVYSSASDGGFYTYEGSFEPVAGRIVAKLRWTACDYCAVRSDDPLPSKHVREYVVGQNSDGSFELDHVVYRAAPNPKLHGTPGGGAEPEP